MNTAWIDQLSDTIKSRSPFENAFLEHAGMLPESYTDKTNVSDALHDVAQLKNISENMALSVRLYEKSHQGKQSYHLRIYHLHTPVEISDVIPIMDKIGIKAINSDAFELRINDLTYWISDYCIRTEAGTSIDMDRVGDIEKLFTNVLVDVNENDGFNRLIILTKLNDRQISLLRAYAKYIHQTRFRFSQQYIEESLCRYPDIARDLVCLFENKFDTSCSRNNEQFNQINNAIKTKLEAVTNLDDDRILSKYWGLIKATIRTNFYQTTSQGEHKPYLSFKLKSAEISELPLPYPLYEIYVYSARFEGIHLRGGKIARGGIRWSDRKEDYRTEVLGLMKAQKVKNSVIVPTGAKGGFVLKKADKQKQSLKEEVIACYELFISGLLDITDNLIEGVVKRPDQVVCYDDEDPYLVVAADKGTASFSDIANKISGQYKFWLGDAFASGGSAGYDHKKMGITARGAWESIKRHFSELKININSNEFSMVGIGDMSGDVFGNGALYSKKIQLVAAFDHRHIFIDPTPDCLSSYEERKRLFNLPHSSWDDYNKKLISSGGGVYARSAKVIPISSQAKTVLGINEDELTPNDLIKAILKAPVDLLYNGGIGTYVKSTHESHEEVGDKTNEFCRVNAAELRCKVVGEGGNLGFTQQARVEYALNGGLINADFIDNSAGVDCSDHEVNIKILLNKLMIQGKMTLDERNVLLASMQDEVANLVLADNYHQALVLGYSSIHSANYSDLYQSQIKKLEMYVNLSRVVENLPDDKKLAERKALGKGLTKPELAVLLAYTKNHIKTELIDSDLINDSYFSKMLNSAFPQKLIALFNSEVERHQLRNEIIATQLSNKMINRMGVTFIYRMQEETGSSIQDIAKAFLIANDVYGADENESAVVEIDGKADISVSYHLLHLERQLLNMATRWFLRNNRMQAKTSDLVRHYREAVKQLSSVIPTLIRGETKNNKESVVEQFMRSGLSREAADKFAIIRVMYTALNITEIATKHHCPLNKAAEIYFATGGRFNLIWFRDQLARDSREGFRNSLARLTLRDDLDYIQTFLSKMIIKLIDSNEKPDSLIDTWIAKNEAIFLRWESVVTMTQEHYADDYCMYFIALRELNQLLSQQTDDAHAGGVDVRAAISLNHPEEEGVEI